MSPYTARLRPRTACGYCAQAACLACVKQFLLTNVTEPHCMHCRRGLSAEILDGLFSRSFRHNELRKHMVQVLMERERSLFPQTLAVIEREDAQAAYMRAFQKHGALLQRLSPRDVAPLDPALLEQINSVREKLALARARINELQGETAGGEAQQGAANRRGFMRKCPSCPEGFLSTQWRCPLCATRVCRLCLAVKDGDAAHECREEDVQSARTIETETRACPHCAVRVQKSEGCFAPDTPILMWDGSVKESQDIAVNDKLVGDDGEPRTVLQTLAGDDDMFCIEQVNGAAYTVNRYHTLALKFSGDESTCFGSEKRFGKQPVELTVNDFIGQPASVQRELAGYKSTAGINYSEQPVPLDPHTMGLYIGKSFAMDDSLRCAAHAMVHKATDNPLQSSVQSIDMETENRIPEVYMLNSRSVRLQLLAGIIEGCATLEGVSQSNHVLARQIVLLSQSLGVNACIIGEELTLLGLDETRIPRNTLKVTPVGRGRYHGWLVDGNHRFLLQDFTVVRNCNQMFCTACNNAFDWRTGQKLSGVIHNPHFHEYQMRNAAAQQPVQWANACEQNAHPAAWPWTHTFVLVRALETHLGYALLSPARAFLTAVNRFMLERSASAQRHTAYGPACHEDLRKRRLRREIDDADWARQLSARETRRQRDNRQRLLDELILAIGRDTLGSLLRSEQRVTPAELSTLLYAPLEAARAYYNLQLAKAAEEGRRVHTVDERWVLLAQAPVLAQQ